MKLVSVILSLVLTCPFARASTCEENINPGAQARVQQGYVSQRNGLPLFYRLKKVPRSKGLVVIANGLRYDLANYDSFIAKLNQRGYSVLLYAHRAQHESEAEAARLNLPIENFSFADLSEDLNDLLVSLKIRKSIHLLGLSYGASVAAQFAATYPDRVKTLHLMAPLVRLSTIYNMWRDSERVLAQLNPFLWWLSVGKDQESNYEKMVTAVQDFDLGVYRFAMPTTLWLAGEEQRFLKEQQDTYWQNVLQKQGGHMIELTGAHHGLPASAPEDLANQLVEKLD